MSLSHFAFGNWEYSYFGYSYTFLMRNKFRVRGIGFQLANRVADRKILKTDFPFFKPPPAPALDGYAFLPAQLTKRMRNKEFFLAGFFLFSSRSQLLFEHLAFFHSTIPRDIPV